MSMFKSAAVQPSVADPVADRMGRALQDYKKLQETKIRLGAELDRHLADIAAMEKEAQASFGTSEPSELVRMADEMDAHDLRELEAFELALSQARAFFAAAEGEQAAR